MEVADDLVRSTLAGNDGHSFRQVEVEFLDPDGIGTSSRWERLSAQGLSRLEARLKMEQVLGGPLEGPFDVDP